MKYRPPFLLLWLLEKSGQGVCAHRIHTSFPLRWLLGSLNFLLTWGLLAGVAWTLLDQGDRVTSPTVVVLCACVVYGLLNASSDLDERKASSGDA